MAAVNYIAAAASLNYVDGYATITDPTNYEGLTWAGTPIAKSLLETTYLELKRGQKISEVAAAMGAEVIAGFPSDALVAGVFHRYDSDLQGQIGVVGAVVYVRNVLDSSGTYIMSYVDASTGQRNYAAHNFAQLKELLTDLGEFSAEMLGRLQGQIGQLMSINTGNVNADLSAIAAIHWQHL